MMRHRQRGKASVLAIAALVALACILLPNLKQATIICDDGSPRTKACWHEQYGGYFCKHHRHERPGASKFGPAGWGRFVYDPFAQTAMDIPSQKIEKIWVEWDAFLVVVRKSTIDCENISSVSQWIEWRVKGRKVCEGLHSAPGHLIVKYADNQLRQWGPLPDRWWRAAGIDPQQWREVEGIDFEPPVPLPLKVAATGCGRRFLAFPFWHFFAHLGSV